MGKELTVLANTSGSGSINYRIGIPAEWARELNIEKGTILNATLEGERIILEKKKEKSPIVLGELKKFIESYTKYPREKIFVEEMNPGDAVSSKKADSIELIEKEGYFYLLFKIGEYEIQGPDIYYSEWTISTKIEEGKFTLFLEKK